MINKRRLRRERRYEQSVKLAEWIKDLEMESAFEKQLRRSGERIDPVFSDDPNAWRTCSGPAYSWFLVHADVETMQCNRCETSCK